MKERDKIRVSEKDKLREKRKLFLTERERRRRKGNFKHSKLIQAITVNIQLQIVGTQSDFIGFMCMCAERASRKGKGMGWLRRARETRLKIQARYPCAMTVSGVTPHRHTPRVVGNGCSVGNPGGG
ncbi:hypothetical protein PoB_006625900 [Plakobranchus ocellatus]|uniref:CCT domain-containing protein n=1 Tax=Plakobranchus ocellatus TaxID=259542 RepID=A0AAV4D6F1_9GAST|nr:hypothetical protein PoB_006625900 [Plakobranchus ocellatus]